MKAHVVALACAAALVGSGCEGPRGPAGKQGPPGPASDAGGTGGSGGGGGGGAVGAAPRILALSPPEGSARSLITITGENFAAKAEENEVWFDGHRAEILEASPERLVVRPAGAEVREARSMQVTVIAGERASNGFAFTAHPSGAGLPGGIPVLAVPYSIAVDVVENRIWAVDPLGGLQQVDFMRHAVRPEPMPAGMPMPLRAGVVPGGSAAYVFGIYDLEASEYTVGRLDLETGAWTHARQIDRIDAMLVEADRILFVHGEEAELNIHRPDLRLVRSISLPPTGFGDGRFDPVDGVAALGGKIYVAGGAAGLYEIDPDADPVTVTAISLGGPLPRVRGIAAAEERLHLLTEGGLVVVDPAGPTIESTTGTFPGVGQGWQRSADGDWYGTAPIDGGVLRWAEDDGLQFEVVPFLPGSFFVRDQDVFWSSYWCFLSISSAVRGGVWRTGPAGTVPLLTDICATDVDPLDDGRLLVAGMTPGGDPADFRVVALDPETGETEVLAEGLDRVSSLVVTDENIYAGAAHYVVRLQLDGSGLTADWATVGDPIVDMERVGDDLYILTRSGIERVALAEGGTGAAVLPLPSDFLPSLGVGILSVRADGTLLVADGTTLYAVVDDELRPIATPPVGFSLQPVMGSWELPSGEVLLGGHAGFHRLMP